jgi:hypothetical protein
MLAMEKTRVCERGDLQEADFVDCIVELVRQLLFATWRIELREVESYEIRPVDFCAYLSARVQSCAHHRILTLCLGLLRLPIYRQLVRDCTGCGLYFCGHCGFCVEMKYSSLDEYGCAIRPEANSKEIEISKGISRIHVA